MKIGIIPARGGSKRIPKKNIINFAGKPMIAHSITAARKTNLLDRIIVSTDDDEIAEVSRQFGAEIPFRRPLELADDFSGTDAVVIHAVGELHANDDDFVCCIYASAPLIEPTTLVRGWQELQDDRWAMSFAATTFDYPIYRALTPLPNGGVEMIHPEHRKTRSQDLPEAIHDAGQFYWGKAGAWRRREDVFGPRSVPVYIPRWRTQDIDTPEDLKRAEMIFRIIQSDTL